MGSRRSMDSTKPKTFSSSQGVHRGCPQGMAISGSEKRVSEIWRLCPLHPSMGRPLRLPLQGSKLHPYPRSSQWVSGTGGSGALTSVGAIPKASAILA